MGVNFPSLHRGGAVLSHSVLSDSATPCTVASRPLCPWASPTWEIHSNSSGPPGFAPEGARVSGFSYSRPPRCLGSSQSLETKASLEGSNR